MKNAITICRSTDPDWLLARTTGIGASEMAAIMGMAPPSWRTGPLKIYTQKIGAVEQDDPSERMEIGLALEPAVIGLYINRSGRLACPSQELLRSPEYPFLLATLDALTWTEGSGVQWPLEIKTTSAFQDDAWADGAPPHVQIQVHQQMLVTGAEMATVAALIGQKLAWCDVPRDERLIEEIIRAGRAFWKRVETQEPPSPDATSSDVLKALFPQAMPGKVVRLGDDACEIAERWRARQQEIKALHAELEEIKNIVRATMGDAETAELPDGGRFTWKQKEVAEHVVKAYSARELRYWPPKGAK